MSPTKETVRSLPTQAALKENEMTQAELVAYRDKKSSYARQVSKDRRLAGMQEARRKKLYINQNAPVPDARARIAAAIAADEKTQRNIEALTGEEE